MAGPCRGVSWALQAQELRIQARLIQARLIQAKQWKDWEWDRARSASQDGTSSTRLSSHATTPAAQQSSAWGMMASP